MNKKILVISEKKLDSNFVSGIELRISQMARYFSDLGLKVDIVFPKNRLFPWNLLFKINNYDYVYYLQASSWYSAAYFLANVNSKAKKIIDLYTPLILEKTSYTPQEKLSKVINRIRKVISVGDFFICATPRQKDYNMGILAALDKLHTDNISIIPFLPKQPLRFNKLKKEGFNVVWLGAFYPWFSGEELVKAISLMEDSVTLTIIGGKNPKTKTFDDAYSKITQLIAKLGLTERIKIYPWTNYEEMFKLLAKSDVGICLTGNSLEDRLAIRSRMISLLQGGLPLVLNGKDEISELAIKLSLGVHIRNNNPTEIKKAILDCKRYTFSNLSWLKVKKEVMMWKDDADLQEFLS